MADEDDNTTEERHPALRNFNRTTFMVKHTLWKTLKWGAVGAAVLGAATVGAAAGAYFIGFPVTGPLTLAAGIITPIVAAISPTAGAWMGGVAANVGMFGLKTLGAIAGVGAATGGVLGLAFSLTDAGEAADAEEERLIARYERNEARQERMTALEQRRDQQRLAMERQGANLGLRPNAPLVGGRRNPQRNQPNL